MENGVGVARGLGMVSEPGEVESAARWVGERGQRSPVQVDLSVEHNRLLDGETGKLVSEHDTVRLGREHARCQALVQTADLVSDERLQQPEVGLRRDDRNRLEHRPRRGTEARGAREHGVPDRVGDLLASGGERLGDEKRVPGRLSVELFGIDTTRLGELRDRRGGERLDRKPADRFAGHELPENDPKRMVVLELVAPERGQDKRRNRVSPATEQPEDVEAGLVRPVHVLEDEDRRCSFELADERGSDLMRPGSTPRERLDLSSCDLGDIEKRPQGTRREERVARSPEHARRVALVVDEPPYERRLTDARFAADEDDAPGLGAGGGKLREEFLALEHFGHALILRCQAVQFKRRPAPTQ